MNIHFNLWLGNFLTKEERAGYFTLVVLMLLLVGCLFCVSFSWSLGVICDCVISCSYSLIVSVQSLTFGFNEVDVYSFL